MKILVIHQFYLLPDQPGGSRFNEMARMWARDGHQVTVVAGTLNYATGEVPDRYRGRWVVKEEDGAITVWRCYVPRSYGASYSGRMWAFCAFSLSAATAVFRTGRPDAVIATSPPLITSIPGWIAARLRVRAVPWFFEIRDLWPESAVTTGVLSQNGLLTRLLYRLERWSCRSADRVTVLTPAFRDDLVRRGLAPPEKIEFVPNGADLEHFQPGSRDNTVRREYGWGERIVALYAGAHGRANAIGQLVEAAAHLSGRPDILLACVGDGPERLRWEEQARLRGLMNIVFLGPKSKARMPEFVNACDIGLAVLQDNPTFRTVYPNKVFDYMACERPTILAIDGVARTLVCEEARAGMFVPPEDGEALAGAIERLADDRPLRERLGRNGRTWVLAHASREVLARRYVDAMQSLVPAQTPTASAKVPDLDRNVVLSVSLYQRYGKRAVDLSVAIVALAVTLPVLLLASAVVWFSVGSPILFRHARPGWRGRLFILYKLRTMTDRRAVDGHLLQDAERLTRAGRLIRTLSVDELPQLFNVLRGDMSMVGPRPLLVQYLDRYTPEQARRHDAKPGITGWAQVNGRNALTWEHRFALDVWYVDHRSLWLDLKILWLTVSKVLTRQGISESGHATAHEFMGTPS